jgi:hypothetical protein
MSTTFLGFQEAAEEFNIPIWKLRKWTWGETPRLASYHPDGSRGRTYLKREDIAALFESSRKPSRG